MDAADRPVDEYYSRGVAAQLTSAKAELVDAETKLEALRTDLTRQQGGRRGPDL